MTEKFIEINHVKLWTAVQGEGSPIVLCHGGPGAYDYLEDVANLVDGEHTVLRYDQRGSGRSGEGEGYRVNDFVEELEGLRRHFGWEKWTVAGHSWGASLALCYAVKYHHRVEKVIYISGIGIDPEWHETFMNNRLKLLGEVDRANFLNLREELIDLSGKEYWEVFDQIREKGNKVDVFDKNRLSEVPSFDEYQLNIEVNQVGSAALNARFDDEKFREAVSRLNVPVFIIHGKNDPRSIRYPAKLAEFLPNGKLYEMDRVGHYPWIEQPEQFKQIIAEILP